MSSPDSEIYSTVLCNTDYLLLEQQYNFLKKVEIEIYRCNHELQVLDQKRDALTEEITKHKQKIDSHLLSISEIFKKEKLDVTLPSSEVKHELDVTLPSSEVKHKLDVTLPRCVVYTDLYKMQHSNAELNIKNFTKNHVVFECKEWKSNAFIQALCEFFPVMEDLGNNKFKKVTLWEATSYWKKKCIEQERICAL